MREEGHARQGRKLRWTRKTADTTLASDALNGPAGTVPFAESVTGPANAVWMRLNRMSTPRSSSRTGFHTVREPTCQKLKSGLQCDGVHPPAFAAEPAPPAASPAHRSAVALAS